MSRKVFAPRKTTVSVPGFLSAPVPAAVSSDTAPAEPVPANWNNFKPGATIWYREHGVGWLPGIVDAKTTSGLRVKPFYGKPDTPVSVTKPASGTQVPVLVTDPEKGAKMMETFKSWVNLAKGDDDQRRRRRALAAFEEARKRIPTVPPVAPAIPAGRRGALSIIDKTRESKTANRSVQKLDYTTVPRSSSAAIPQKRPAPEPASAAGSQAAPDPDGPIVPFTKRPRHGTSVPATATTSKPATPEFQALTFTKRERSNGASSVTLSTAPLPDLPTATDLEPMDVMEDISDDEGAVADLTLRPGDALLVYDAQLGGYQPARVLSQSAASLTVCVFRGREERTVPRSHVAVFGDRYFGYSRIAPSIMRVIEDSVEAVVGDDARAILECRVQSLFPVLDAILRGTHASWRFDKWSTRGRNAHRELAQALGGTPYSRAQTRVVDQMLADRYTPTCDGVSDAPTDVLAVVESDPQIVQLIIAPECMLRLIVLTHFHAYLQPDAMVPTVPSATAWLASPEGLAYLKAYEYDSPQWHDESEDAVEVEYPVDLDADREAAVLALAEIVLKDSHWVAGLLELQRGVAAGQPRRARSHVPPDAKPVAVPRGGYGRGGGGSSGGRATMGAEATSLDSDDDDFASGH
ncbi:hypothetical protein AMAG_14592 [Allomyces macrogynus ATCC 38327]|uniref:Uncharacterized protein n=1 Tax=Allomyces macrogynus (strain ATCC 38327) TaxID=578462 RepID=A0A0L0T714_ALLM3|nr:hypothetical protein AMAG_14592 [Allomyces macrogynus ATCC 38327]|eukprot:KNE70466.1 hypothetical protein AMAG_14592 [Allomyces macrogynus ATCC 38327]